MTDAGPVCDCKVGRTAAKYGLDDLAGSLDESWVEEDESLRSLAARFNTAALRAALAESDAAPLDGEAENVYRLLTDDDVSSGMRTQARRRLEKRGLAVEELESEFVSYQTVNRHLKRCLGTEHPGPDRDPVERGADRVFALQSRTAAVTEDALARARDAGDLTLGEFDAFVDVAVTCRDCGYHASVDALLEEGCRCDDD